MPFPDRRRSRILLFLLAIPFLFLLWFGFYAISPGPPAGARQIEVVIPARSSLSAIETILADNRVIQADFRFAVLAILTGAAKRLRAGEYGFAPGQRPIDVLRILKEGRVLYRPVTIPEGTEMVKVAGILAAGGWAEPERFLHLARDPGMLAELGIPGNSLEGYLFPDTYFLSKGQQGEKEIIEIMVARHFQVYNDIVRSMTDTPPDLSHHAIITLASIVEKETGEPEERPLVASVFLNRLQRGMRLQADPTVRYGLTENAGPLTRDELKYPTPYNTYLVEGLPPGPITNPGMAAIVAVIFPAATDYLYFVAKDDARHHFSRTLQEHNRAVAKYKDGK